MAFPEEGTPVWGGFFDAYIAQPKSRRDRRYYGLPDDTPWIRYASNLVTASYFVPVEAGLSFDSESLTHTWTTKITLNSPLVHTWRTARTQLTPLVHTWKTREVLTGLTHRWRTGTGATPLGGDDVQKPVQQVTKTP